MLDPLPRIVAGGTKLLEHFKIPRSAQLTPGGLRGGGATYMYHAGLAIIPDVLWRLRLKHIATLESYLQEMAADSALSRLPPGCCDDLRVCAKFSSLFNWNAQQCAKSFVLADPLGNSCASSSTFAAEGALWMVGGVLQFLIRKLDFCSYIQLNGCESFPFCSGGGWQWHTTLFSQRPLRKKACVSAPSD